MYLSVRIKFILITAMVLLSNSIKGQQSITVSVFNEATAIPFTTLLNKPIHPGFQIGTELEWKEGNHFRLYPAINLGYMYHQKLFQGIYANLEIGFDYKTSFGLNLKSKLGAGYLHTFATQQEFQLNDGHYTSRRDKGNSRFMPSLSLGIGYDVRRNDPYSPEIFMLYQAWIEYPYSPGFIPLMSHTNVHFGAKFFTSKNKK